MKSIRFIKKIVLRNKRLSVKRQCSLFALQRKNKIAASQAECRDSSSPAALSLVHHHFPTPTCILNITTKYKLELTRCLTSFSSLSDCTS